ncbi:hypothetical protein Vadar_009749 [Vaccinium darrowii]|uniref:Uncharacterized protein n=1 Tax=Vaccinium darrowii TaxID=229202 RepID=A0ACB7XPW6_9ERIC|nr:hypothetical protein Vadar_009749 [Vaccinium darrowii]
MLNFDRWVVAISSLLLIPERVWSLSLRRTRSVSLWFPSVEMWHNQRIKPLRCIWISCYGVPLSAWHSETFHNIGKLMGEVIKLDEITAKSIAFEGRMFIVTDQLHCINEMVDLNVKGEVYPIKIVEDPFAETSCENRIVTSIKVN